MTFRKPIRKKVLPVHIKVHPNFYSKLEKTRKKILKKTGKNLNQTEITELFSKINIKLPVFGKKSYAFKKTKQKR